MKTRRPAAETAAIVSVFESLYREGRATVEKDVEGMTDALCRWRGIDPNGVVTIGSLLIHLAGYENMLRNALLGVDLHVMTSATEWRGRYACGFPREFPAAGFPVGPPVDKTFTECLAVLQEETAMTFAFIADFDKHDIDLDATTMFYRDGREFQEAHLIPHLNSDLLYYKAMHDRYHRGHITQIKYTYRAMVAKGMIEAFA